MHIYCLQNHTVALNVPSALRASKQGGRAYIYFCAHLRIKHTILFCAHSFDPEPHGFIFCCFNSVNED